jgi:hypothetical protein
MSNKTNESIPYGGMEPGSSNARASRRVEVASPVKAAPQPKGDTVNDTELTAGASTHIEGGGETHIEGATVSDKHDAAANMAAKPKKATKVAKASKTTKKKAGK